MFLDDDVDGSVCEESRVCANGVDKEHDDDWFEDSTDARQQRINALSTMAKSLALCDDVEKSEAERADLFFKHITLFNQQGEVLLRAREIKHEAERLDLGPRAVLVLVEVLLSNPTTLMADIKKFSQLFILFTRSGDEPKRVQHYMWGSVAKLIERFRECLLAKACHLLKQLYDFDIIEEDVILAWYDKGVSCF